MPKNKITILIILQGTPSYNTFQGIMMTNFQRPNLQRELIKKNYYLFNFHIILSQLTKFEAQRYNK